MESSGAVIRAPLSQQRESGNGNSSRYQQPLSCLGQRPPPQPSVNRLHWKVVSTAEPDSDRSCGPSDGAMPTCAQHPGPCWGPWTSEASAPASPNTSISPSDCQARIFTHVQATPEATHVLDEVWGEGQTSGKPHTCPRRSALCSLFSCVPVSVSTWSPTPNCGQNRPLRKKYCGSPAEGH